MVGSYYLPDNKLIFESSLNIAQKKILENGYGKALRVTSLKESADWR